ncbi:MAG: NAD(P)/FAD-dependent oxidoreductase [Gemmatimonadota bacterium]
MERFDAVFVGSGHNALITAAYLARAGWSVLVLEKNDRPGGLVRTDELTLPGFKHDVYSAAHPLFLTGAAYADLGAELSARGLEYLNTDLPTGVSLPDGRTAVFPRDVGAAVAEFERLSPGDGAGFGAMMQEFGAYAGDVFSLFNLDLTSGQAQKTIRGLMDDPDGPGFTEFAAEFMTSARDVLERRFRSPVAHAMIAPWVMHLGRTPDQANGGFWVPLTLMALMGGGMAVPRGGSEMLARALVRLIEDHGGVVRSSTPVERILVQGGRATGVRTAGGEEIRAQRAVVASVNPDQLYLRLLADADVPAPLVRQSERYRYGRGCVQIQLALSEAPRWADERFNRVGQPHLTSGMEAVTLGITHALNGYLPAEPTISLDTPTNLDPSRAPEGKAILRLQMLEIPCRPRGDAAGSIDVGDGTWTDDLKERWADRVMEVVERHLPGVGGTVLARHVTSPDDLARYNPNCGPGDPYGGSHDISQSYLFRPLPGQPGHRTAVPNVFMVGAATWPGHGVNGGSGYIVAKQLLEDGPGRSEIQAVRV